MNGSYKHLLNVAANELAQEAAKKLANQSGDTLEYVGELANLWTKRNERVKELEYELKLAKQEFNEVSQELIPKALLNTGLSEVKLADGRKVIVTDELSASVKDYEAFGKFLDERGDSSLLKTTIEVGKIPKPIVKKLLSVMFNDFGLDSAEAVTKIHPATLKKYVKELCGVGGKTEAQMNIEDIDKDMLSIYTFNKTKIK